MPVVIDALCAGGVTSSATDVAVGPLPFFVEQPTATTVSNAITGIAGTASFTRRLLPWRNPRLDRPSLALNAITFAFNIGRGLPPASRFSDDPPPGRAAIFAASCAVRGPAVVGPPAPPCRLPPVVPLDVVRGRIINVLWRRSSFIHPADRAAAPPTLAPQAP